MLDIIDTNKPFSTTFNAAVLHIADKLVGDFIVADDAPSTFEQLIMHLDAGKTLVVYSGGSDHTIFGDPAVNHAFRAWHDWTHWKYGLDFSLSGECGTCNYQIEHIKQIYGGHSDLAYWQKLLIAEVIGQRQYYERYRAYISDQRAFVTAYMLDQRFALDNRW